MRAKVWKAREESPLFDCQQYADGLERLYDQMWTRHARGEPVDHIAALAQTSMAGASGAAVAAIEQ